MRQLIGFELQKILQKKVIWMGFVLILFMNFMFYSHFCISSTKFRTPDGEVLRGQEAWEYDRSVAKNFSGALTVKKAQEILSQYPLDAEIDYENYATENSTYLAVKYAFYQHGIPLDEQASNAELEAIISENFDNISLGYSYPWASLLFYLCQLMIMVGFLIVIAIAPIFSEEYGKGMDSLILTSRFGKTKCARAKILSAFLFSLLLTGGILLLNMLAFLLTYGTEGWDASIQLNGTGYYSQLPYPMNCSKALFFNVFLCLAGSSVLTAITLFISVVSRTSFLSLVVSAFLYAAPAFSSVSEESALRIMIFNPIITFINQTYMGLDKLPIWGTKINYIWIICVFAAAVSICARFVCRRAFARHQVL